MAEADAKRYRPTITKGRWIAPTVLPSWNACVRDPSAPPTTGQQLPDQIDIRDYPYTQYWKNVEEEHARATAGKDEERDDMDTQANEDEMGVPLPDRAPVAAVKPTVNVRVIFDQQCAKIEKGFCGLGLVNAEGSQFKFVMPPGHFGQQINERVFSIPFWLRQAASQRYTHMYEQRLVIMKVLPVPLHTSPLALLMVREAEPAMRYKDAISTLMGLHILRHAMHEMDAENEVHKTKCWHYYGILEAYIADRLWETLDKLAEEEKAAGVTREVAQHVAHKFGDAMARFALDMVHAIEWCCMDLLRLPHEWRYLFMTPNEFPQGENMFKVAFDQMRIQTVRYVTERNKLYCGLYREEEDPKTKAKKRVYVGNDPDTFCAMQLDRPPLAERPYLLGDWKQAQLQKMDPKLAASSLFGIYGGWIDYHTLREYMRMLEVDARPETLAKEAARFAKVKEDTLGIPAGAAPAVSPAAATVEDTTEAMDTGKDDDGQGDGLLETAGYL